MSLLTIAGTFPEMEGVISAVERASKGHLPYTREAVKAATSDVVQRTWIQYAQGAVVSYSGGTFRVSVVTGSYVRSIQDGLRFMDDLTGEVSTTSPHGALIENGQPPRDMKAKMLSSPKAVKGKDGARYITVPFRHGTPGTTTMPAMPKAVHTQAQRLTYSRRNNGLTGKDGGGRTYTWGGRLGSDNTGARSHIAPSNRVNEAGQGYTHRTGTYSGMVRVGGPNQSQYMTFRRLSDNSDPRSWMYPGVKPRPIREAVVENTRSEVIQLLRRGFEMDLYFMGLGGGED